MTEQARKFWTTIERVAMIVGLLGLSFSAGMNWHRLDTVEAAQRDDRAAMTAAIVGISRQDDQIKAEYARKDVLSAELKSMNDKLEAIQRDMRR